MAQTKVDIIIEYERYGNGDLLETREDYHSLSIQESEKSHYTPQSMLVSTDMEKAIKDFVGQQAKKYKHLGFDRQKIV